MENQNNLTTGEQEKTFTQEQVNAIVGKRLAEQKQQLESELSKKETELNQRAMSLRAKELLQERGLPKDLGDVLRYEDEESLVRAIDTIGHTRGFSENNNNQADPTRDKLIIEHKLERGSEYGKPDPIGDAFKLKG